MCVCIIVEPRTPIGQKKVSLLVRCPHFRDKRAVLHTLQARAGTLCTHVLVPSVQGGKRCPLSVMALYIEGFHWAIGADFFLSKVLFYKTVSIFQGMLV